MPAPLIRRAVAALPVAAALLAVPAAAQTADVLYACVGKAAGVMRLVDAGASCRTGETLVSWNVQGIPGPQGPQGIQGLTGAPGATGPRGPAGPQTVASALVGADGSIAVSAVPAGATFTSTREGVGTYRITVTGLGTSCPLATANAFGGYMSFTGGSCTTGFLDLGMVTSTGTDLSFMVVVVATGSAAASARQAPAAAISF